MVLANSPGEEIEGLQRTFYEFAVTFLTRQSEVIEKVMWLTKKKDQEMKERVEGVEGKTRRMKANKKK